MVRFAAEIGIMIAILVGAWIVKVVCVAAYITVARRRSAQRQALQALAMLGNTRSSGPHKPAPEHAIAALPVVPYAYLRALRALSAGTGSSAGADACKAQPSHQRRLSLDAAPQRDQQSRRQLWRRSSADAGGLDAGGARQPDSSSAGPAAAAAATPPGEAAAPAAAAPEEEADTCAICFSEYEAADLVKLMPCSHFFHIDCIDLWLAKDNSCPLCKRPAWQPPPVEVPVAAGGDAAGDAHPDGNTAEGDVAAVRVEGGGATRTPQHVVVVVGLPAPPAATSTSSSAGPVQAAVTAQQQV